MIGNANLADPDFIYVWVAYGAAALGFGALAVAAALRLNKWRRAAESLEDKRPDAP